MSILKFVRGLWTHARAGFVVFLLGCMMVLFCACAGIYLEVMFEIDIENNLKRAADANQPEMALQEMDEALAAIDEWGLCTETDSNHPDDCYTSVVYRTPDEDVNFWRENLIQARDELASLPEDSDPLMVSNVLLKLRETLLDQGKNKEKVTYPSGVSRYPYNALFGLLFWMGFLLAFGGVVMFTKQLQRKTREMEVGE